MAKPFDPQPESLPADRRMKEPVTPGPEITIEAGTPPPELLVGNSTPPPDFHLAPDTPVPEVLTGDETPVPEVLADELTNPVAVGRGAAATPPPDFLTAPATPPPVLGAHPVALDSRRGTPQPLDPLEALEALEQDDDKIPTPKPLPAAWAAQPLAPMPDEATVPLPVEEVEFASPEGHFGDGRAQLRTADAPEPPRLPPRPPAPPVSAVDNARAEVPSRPVPPPAPEPVRARPAAPPAAPVPVAITQTPTSGPHPLLPPGATWSEALSQRPRKKRLKPWFEEAFDEDYLRTLPFLTPEQTLREVEFLKESFRLPRDAELLDVGCGYGRHAIELGQGGYRVTGIDLSLPLLIRAADESQRRSLSVNFVHADMREMAFDGQFDGAYSFLTSFGYFDEETNLKVAASIHRALRPGGRFLLDTMNRDYIVADLPTRVWWEGEGCVVLEEVDFNYQTSRLTVRRSIVFQDGRQVEHEMSIRAYSLHELGKLLRQAGFRILEVSGGIATRGNFFGAASRSVMVLCERPAD
jgi:SAM-dependent methyltransferase